MSCSNAQLEQILLKQLFVHEPRRWINVACFDLSEIAGFFADAGGGVTGKEAFSSFRGKTEPCTVQDLDVGNIRRYFFVDA